MSGSDLASHVSDTQMREAQATCEGLAPGSRFNPSNLTCTVPVACTPAFASTLNSRLSGQPASASCAAGTASASTPAPAGGATPATTPPPATTPATTPTANADEPAAGADGAVTQRAFVPIVPNPSVPIPGVTFTPAVEEESFISIPYLAQYISGIYRLSVGLGAILAAIMIVFGGFKYMLAASLPDVKDGKTIITDAVIGLAVLLSSFLILKTINPKLVEVSPLRVQRILEEAPVRQAGEFTGNPSATGFDTTSHSEASSCGGGAAGGASGQTHTYEGVSFSVLPLRESYEQGQAPWGNISYGPNLTNNESLNPCHGDGSHGNGFSQPVVNGCTQTFKNGGCGPTAFATIMAFYGIQVTNPGDAALASHIRLQSGDGLVELAAHPQGQTISRLMQARVGSHLFDPIDAGRLIITQGHGGRGGSAFTTEIPSMEGFTKRSINSSAAAAAEIRAGHPLVFYCNHCMLKLHNMSDADHRGGLHYMVIHGVSQDNRWFLVQDSGGGGSAGGRYLSATEVDSGHPSDHPSEKSVKLTAVIPSTATTHPCNTSNDGGGGNGLGSNAVSHAGDVAQRATSGEVTRAGFFYQPPSGDAGWDHASPSQLFFPQRFATAFRSGTRPRVHLYIFIHGLNSHGTTLDQSVADSGSWVSSISAALNEIAGSKNVIVAAPYDVNGTGRSYMDRFNLEGFYTAAVAGLTSEIPGFLESDIEDVVVGGHSAATCQGPGSPVLKQALVPTLRGKRMIGVVAYDGCMSDSMFTASNFRTPSGVALLMNSDLKSLNDGMGFDTTGDPPTLQRSRYSLIATQWELPRIACGAYVENKCPMDAPPVEPSAPSYNQRRCNACYGKTTDGKQIVEFQTAYGHRASVLHMTKYAFGSFYGN